MHIQLKVCPFIKSSLLTIVEEQADLDKDLPFSQPVTFAHMEWQRCLAASHKEVEFAKYDQEKSNTDDVKASRYRRAGISL